MDLRFYRTGTIAKAPIHPQDIARHRRPAAAAAAGSDLRGRRNVRSARHASRLCRGHLRGGARRSRAKGQDFEVWLYRGAWEEWEPHEIERVVPLSPDDLERKKLAIFRHQSQKDRAMFPGSTDQREFWQRAEDRNRHTAKVYDSWGCRSFTPWKASCSGAGS